MSKRVVILAVGVTTGLCGVIFLSTVWLGDVFKLRFSPSRFLFQKCTFYQIPLTGIRVSRKDCSTIKPQPLRRHLKRKGYLPQEPRDDWTIVSEDRFGVAGVSGVGVADRFVGDFLSKKSTQRAMLEWSRNHPDKAKRFWRKLFIIFRDSKPGTIVKYEKLLSKYRLFGEPYGEIISRK